MKKILVILLALMVSAAFAGATFAAEEKKAAETKNPCAAKEEKKETEKVMQSTGEITAVDAKANKFTLKSSRKGEVTCEVTADTKIMMGKESKTLADVKVGNKVTCKYAMKDGKHVCKSMDIKAAEKKEENKEEKK